MADYGFITDKLEIKFLILYITSRLVGPAPFEVLQELSMCDSGVDYFDFSECLADLVRTEHLAVDKNGLYLITEKGRGNGAICESSLPYSVRMQVEKEIAPHNERLKRQNLVNAHVEQRGENRYVVTLSLSDELDHLMKLELLVTRPELASQLQKQFKARAETVYSEILSILYRDDPEKV